MPTGWTDKDWHAFLNQDKTCTICGVTWNDCLVDHACDARDPAIRRALRLRCLVDGIRVMVTRDGICIPEAVIIERAKNILQGIEGFDPDFDTADNNEGDPT